jgi:hypothetical protein
MRTLLSFKRAAAVVAVAAVAVMSAVSIAFADNVQNDVVAGGNDTVTQGNSTTLNYRIQQNNGDGQTGCNAADGSAASVSINGLPAGATATPNPVSFTACGTNRAVAIQTSDSTPVGNYVITVTVSDSGTGSYNTNPATFTLHVLAGTPSDTTPPEISYVLNPASPPADGNGWYRGPVSVDWTVTDNESTITGTTGCADTTKASDGTYSLTCQATSSGGTSSKTASFKIDQTAPVVQCGTADGIWHKTDVAIACTADDGSGSGLANALNDASFNLETTVAPGTETSNASTGSRDVFDVAGNKATAGPVIDNKVDKKAPSFDCDDPDGVWHKLDVSLPCTATDNGSGLDATSPALFNLVTNVPADTETANASTDSQLLKDVVGHEVTAGPISGNKVDKKAPSVDCDDADGQWHATDVTIACTANDGGSGLADSSNASFSLSTIVPGGTETNNALTGSKSVGDAVGNSATAGPVGGNKVDKKGPVVSCNTPAPTFTVNQSPANVTGTATDGGSGPASQTVSKPATTSSAGSKTVSLTADDAVGNTGSTTCSYSVLYGFEGLFAPIDRPDTRNVSKAGQAIPLKWRLVDANGAPITSLTSLTVQVSSLSCTLGTTDDLIEEYAANASGLQNLGDGYYQFNWKSPTSYANSCKSLKLDLGEGSPRTVAYVQFKK